MVILASSPTQPHGGSTQAASGKNPLLETWDSTTDEEDESHQDHEITLPIYANLDEGPAKDYPIYEEPTVKSRY